MGLLEDIPYVKLIRGVMIVREEDSKRVIRFLSGYNADVHIREVIHTPEDESVLSTR